MVLHDAHRRRRCALGERLLSLVIISSVPLASLHAQISTSSCILSVAVLQAALDSRNFGVGLIDGRDGPRTRGALLDYCRAERVSEVTGRKMLLEGTSPLLTSYLITEEDLQVGLSPADWMEASEMHTMSYTSLDEVLSEKFHTSRGLLAHLNPGITNWNTVVRGQSITLLTFNPVNRSPNANLLEIDCTSYRLRVYDSENRLVASFPCSIAKNFQKIPVGELRLVAFAPNPNYTFDPANFPESARAQKIGRKLILPPGPNNPVGSYWLSLSLPGFGIHGTPYPETIGRSESHGCFRLTNWDITHLARRVIAGTPVRILAPVER